MAARMTHIHSTCPAIADRYDLAMSFTLREIDQWHRDREAASDKIEVIRARDSEHARRASAVAMYIDCGTHLD